MKKVVSLIAILLTMVLLFAGCSSQKLADNFDEAKVKESAKLAISLLNEQKYDEFSELSTEEVKSTLTADTIKNAINQVMPEAGAFKKYTSEAVVGQKDKDGNDCAVAQIIAKYEKQSVTYTVSFDKDMKIIGFYLK